MNNRLNAFAPAQVEDIRDKLGTILTAPWPAIDGCLAVLGTSRTGSTYLARELECVFDIGRMRESLNPAQVKNRAMAEIVAERRGGWFSFKAGPLGVIAGEMYGFFDAYLARTAFILLARRDIVAQAVSLEKAEQTGRWHSTGAAGGTAVYTGLKIANAIKNIAVAVEQLRLYAQRSGRPRRVLAYEDFSSGDFWPAVAACDALGVPRRQIGGQRPSKRVERLGDSTNKDWAARFWEEMDLPMRGLIERYQAGVQPSALLNDIDCRAT